MLGGEHILDFQRQSRTWRPTIAPCVEHADPLALRQLRSYGSQNVDNRFIERNRQHNAIRLFSEQFYTALHGKQSSPIVAEPIIELGIKIAPFAVLLANGFVSVLGTRKLYILPP